MVWSALILSVILLAVFCVYCYFKYEEVKQIDTSEDKVLDLASSFSTSLSSYTELKSFWLGLLIVSSIVLFILLIVLIFLRKRIAISIQLINEASKAVGSMMSTLYFPIVPFLFRLVVVGWFVTVAMFLASSGEPEYQVSVMSGSTCSEPCLNPNNENQPFVEGDTCDINTFNCNETCHMTCDFYRYGPTDSANYFQFYNLFGFFWGLFFISAMDQMVLAGAFASWYWALDKKNVPTLPLLSSFGRTMRYHLGTIAFGSLIIAIIRMIRVMIEAVEKKLKEYNQDNPLVKGILCCCRCFFWCLEKFMKFLNRNAYIMTAVYGKNFCVSAKNAFVLLMRNVVRVAVLDSITDFLLLLSKLVIVGTVACVSFYTFSGKISTEVGDDSFPDLNYYFIPILIITLGAYFIADIFFGVYEMTVDTLFLCFLEDIERHDGSPEKPYYMSKGLKNILDLENTSPSLENNKSD